MAGEDPACDKNIAKKNAFINHKNGSQDFKDATITSPAVESAFLNIGSGHQVFSGSKIECGPSIWDKFKRLGISSLFNYDGSKTKKYSDFPEHLPAELTQNIPAKEEGNSVEVKKKSSTNPKSNPKPSSKKP
ncbi:uncharacterized protein LOC124835676 [Vigna umbellata]|uniref:uncharacterized protein LOC124835676 n=1 Tax=Vigna umbellata TaxID=87088 RepID=UPI001F5FCE12|nr:uncharacterized protein LOC124835676 [Vigna umbellata]